MIAVGVALYFFCHGEPNNYCRLQGKITLGVIAFYRPMDGL